MAADRTVLSSDYITETMGDEGVYTELTTEFRGEVSGEVSSATDGLDLPQGIDVSGVDGDAIAQEAISEEYVREEVSGNVDRLYEFLHGERDDVEFVVDIRPVKESIESSIVDGVGVDTPTFVGESSDRIETEEVAALGESQQSYQAVQSQYDLSDAEAQVLREEAESKASQLDAPENVTDAAVEIQFTVIDALAGEITYDEYTSQIDSEEQALKEAIATEGLADVDDQIQLGDEDEDPADTFGTAATAVQWLSTFTWLLPVVSLILIGLIAAITRSFDGTAMPTGAAVLIAGLIGAILSFGLSGTVLGRVEEAATDGSESETSAFVDGLLSAVDGLFGTLGTQSILLVVLGLLFVGLAYADRNGHLESVRETIGMERETSATPRRQVQTQPQAASSQTGQQPRGQQPAGQQPAGTQPGEQPSSGRPGQQPTGSPPGQQPPVETDQTPPGEPASEEPSPGEPQGTEATDYGTDTTDDYGTDTTDEGSDFAEDSADRPDDSTESTETAEDDESEPSVDDDSDEPYR
jgi:hypothetical protein